MYKKTRNQGITLIALVITIIVLLILAGVTIATLTGQNGILTQAKNTKEQWEQGHEEEENRLSSYEDIIEDKTSGGIWKISLSTTKLSTTVKINVNSKFYTGALPDTLKEYKELYILKAMGADREFESLEEYICTNFFAGMSMTEIIDALKQQTGTTYTRDEIIYELVFGNMGLEGVKNEDDVLKMIGYSDENIKQIEEEYEKNKELQEVPEKYLNRTYKVIYPDGTEETVLGKDLATYRGEYSVNDNKSYTIKIVENEVEQELNINVVNFVKYPTYEDEYYTYQFDEYNQGYSVAVKDKTLSQYGNILENIDGINIVRLYQTFQGCSNLIQAPKIPNNVTNMTFTFSECTNLSQAPDIPSGVKYMNCAFLDCKNLIQAPNIPSSAEYIDQTFYGCTKLSGKLTVNSSHIDTTSTVEEEGPGHRFLRNTGTQGSGLTVVVPNDEVRELLIQNSGYDTNKVKIVASE